MHVQQTLPSIAAEAPDEIIFVDYGCPQQSGDWVQAHFPEANYPGVKVVRVDDDPGFCVARARNMGAAASTSEWLCFIDADVIVTPGWVAWLRKNLQPDAYWRASRLPTGKRDAQTWGTFLCPRAIFEKIGGYDDVFRGWGGEDADLYLRLGAHGIPEKNFPLEFVRAIEHGDSLRMLHDDLKDKRLHWAVITAYRDIKLYTSNPSDKSQMLPRETRQSIWDEIVRRVRLLDANPQTKLRPFKIDLQRDKPLTAEHRLRTKASYVFEIALGATGRLDE